MKVRFYKIECLTDLHAGSSDINFGVVDNEVEKDPVTGDPVIHASGIKGALRDKMEKTDPKKAERVFGKPGSREEASSAGLYKFFDAHLFSRPLRLAGDPSHAWISTTTVTILNDFLHLTGALQPGLFAGCGEITRPAFRNALFLSTVENASVEGERTDVLQDPVLGAARAVTDVLLGEGKDFALAASFADFDLPVLARNCLDENNPNLWYEEVVPGGSVFTFAVAAPDDDAEGYEVPEIMQIGANASMGRGFVQITEIKRNA